MNDSKRGEAFSTTYPSEGRARPSHPNATNDRPHLTTTLPSESRGDLAVAPAGQTVQDDPIVEPRARALLEVEGWPTAADVVKRAAASRYPVSDAMNADARALAEGWREWAATTLRLRLIRHVREGDLRPFSPSNGRLFGRTDDPTLDSWRYAPDEQAKAAALLSRVDAKDIYPIFEVPARPQRNPALLDLLPRGTEIRVVSNVGPVRGECKDRVGTFANRLDAIRARQARGLFIVAEAAQVLAEARGCSVDGLVAKFEAAFRAGELRIRDAGDGLPKPATGGFFMYSDLVNVADVDAWLVLQGAGYRFPDDPAQAGAGFSAAGAVPDDDVMFQLTEAAAMLAGEQWKDTEGNRLLARETWKARHSGEPPPQLDGKECDLALLAQAKHEAELELQAGIDRLMQLQKLPLLSPLTLLPTLETKGAWVVRSDLVRLLAEGAHIESGSLPANVPIGMHSPVAAAERRARRLARFREIGGDMRRAGTGWQQCGKRGALAALVREEKAASRARSDSADVRDDLTAAFEGESGS